MNGVHHRIVKGAMRPKLQGTHSVVLAELT